MPPVTLGTALVFGLVAVALVLFVTEALPSDVTAIGVLVALAVLEPWTGVSAAEAIGGFAFLLAVTFAGSGAFMTPIGYQTNLMVYGPGGYRFTDYLRVGAPLQLLLAAVVTVAVAAIFGV